MSGDYLTWRRGRGTTLSSGLIFGFSPRASSLFVLSVFGSFDFSISSSFGQPCVCGKQNVKPRSLRKRFQHRIRYGFGRIFVDFATTDPTISYSNASVEQSEVVENLGLRTHG